MKLHLGVIDIPYTDGPQTTGDVAEILEAKYGVMTTFYELNAPRIADMMADSLQGALENILAGAPPTINPFGTAENKIKAAFSEFLVKEEMNGRTNGVPTKAALDGKSKRLKRTKGPPRPSFIDSGTYENNFKAWVET